MADNASPEDNDIDFSIIYSSGNGFFGVEHKGTEQQALAHIANNPDLVKQQIHDKIIEELGASPTKEAFAAKKIEISKAYNGLNADYKKNNPNEVNDRLHKMVISVPFEIKPTAPAENKSTDEAAVVIKKTEPTGNDQIYDPSKTAEDQGSFFFEDAGSVTAIQTFMADKDYFSKEDIDGTFGIKDGDALKISLQLMANDALEVSENLNWSPEKIKAVTDMKGHGTYSKVALDAIAETNDYKSNPKFKAFAQGLHKLKMDLIEDTQGNNYPKLDRLYNPANHDGVELYDNGAHSYKNSAESSSIVIGLEKKLTKPEQIATDAKPIERETPPESEEVQSFENINEPLKIFGGDLERLKELQKFHGPQGDNDFTTNESGEIAFASTEIEATYAMYDFMGLDGPLEGAGGPGDDYVWDSELTVHDMAEKLARQAVESGAFTNHETALSQAKILLESRGYTEEVETDGFFGKSTTDRKIDLKSFEQMGDMLLIKTALLNNAADLGKVAGLQETFHKNAKTFIAEQVHLGNLRTKYNDDGQAHDKVLSPTKPFNSAALDSEPQTHITKVSYESNSSQNLSTKQVFDYYMSKVEERGVMVSPDMKKLLEDEASSYKITDENPDVIFGSDGEKNLFEQDVKSASDPKEQAQEIWLHFRVHENSLKVQAEHEVVNPAPKTHLTL